MTKAPSILFVLAVAGPMVLLNAPAHAQSGSDGVETPKELFEGATRMAMKALELLIKTLPQYEPPVVLKNGDILIKRKRTNDAPGEPGGSARPDEHRI